MKILIADDNLTCRKLLKKYLSDHGNCDIAVDGSMAIKAVRNALSKSDPYDLICLDIEMPNMNGQETLIAIRQAEAELDIAGLDCSKVIMTTVCDDKENILTAFRNGCEVYLIKPIEKDILLAEIEKLGLIQKQSA